MRRLLLTYSSFNVSGSGELNRLLKNEKPVQNSLFGETMSAIGFAGCLNVKITMYDSFLNKPRHIWRVDQWLRHALGLVINKIKRIWQAKIDPKDIQAHLHHMTAENVRQLTNKQLESLFPSNGNAHEKARDETILSLARILDSLKPNNGLNDTLNGINKDFYQRLVKSLEPSTLENVLAKAKKLYPKRPIKNKKQKHSTQKPKSPKQPEFHLKKLPLGSPFPNASPKKAS